MARALVLTRVTTPEEPAQVKWQPWRYVLLVRRPLWYLILLNCSVDPSIAEKTFILNKAWFSAPAFSL